MPNDLYNDLPLTNFPSSVDQFMTFLNIVASDGPLIAQYQQAMEAGNTTLANQILTQIPQGTQKIITATDLNTLSQAMLAIERFYLTDIEPYVQNLQQNWLSVINQFSYQGVWQSGTSYVTNNLVSYTVSGLNLVYIALSDVPVGTVPTNTQYWRLLTIQGQAGASGTGLSYRQEWNNSTTYSTDDAVTYDGALWMALQPSQNRIPDSNPSYWQMVMSLETTTYPIQDTEPTNLQVEGLWFNTSNNPTQYIYSGDVINYLDNINGEVIGTTLEEKEAKLTSTKINLKTSINGSASIVGDVFSDYSGAIDNFRSTIATAITNKGVVTNATDTPDQMAMNIQLIPTGYKIQTGIASGTSTSVTIPVDFEPINFVLYWISSSTASNSISIFTKNETGNGIQYLGRNGVVDWKYNVNASYTYSNGNLSFTGLQVISSSYDNWYYIIWG